MQNFQSAAYLDIQFDYFTKMNQRKKQGTPSIVRITGVITSCDVPLGKLNQPKPQNHHWENTG